MPYNRNMTAEMVREATTTPDDAFPKTDTSTTPSEQAHTTAPLATPEELAGLDRYIAAAEEKNGPVPDEIREQFYADLAAADAKIGRIR